MMSWLGVFYVAYRLVKEQINRSYAKVEVERIRREHPYRTPKPDLNDPNNDKSFFSWEYKDPEMIKVRQREKRERLEQVLQGGGELHQKRLNERKAKGIFDEKDERMQKTVNFDRERITKMLEAAKQKGI